MSDVIDLQDQARALETVRAGNGVSLGSIGGKYSKTLTARSGQFWIEEFDEGQSFDREISEEQAIQLLAANPEAVAAALAQPIWRAFYQAFFESERAQAQAALDATAGLPDYGAQFRYVYEAFLAWPEQRPSPQLKEQLRSFVEGGMVRQSLRAGSWVCDETVVTKKSLEYFTALGEMTAWSRSLYQYRSECHERLGNLQAALDDCLLEYKFHSNREMPARIQALRAALRGKRT
jgi:hypothetical protein